MTAREFLKMMDNAENDPYTTLDVCLDDVVQTAAIPERDLFDGTLRVTVLSVNETENAWMMCDADVRRCVKDFWYLIQQGHRATKDTHPSVQWVLNSRANYDWLRACFEALVHVHLNRFPSAAVKYDKALLLDFMPPYVKTGKHTTASPPPQQLPCEYQVHRHVKRWENVVEANREFYIHEMYTARWSGIHFAPHWFVTGVKEWEAELASAGVPSNKAQIVTEQTMTAVKKHMLADMAAQEHVAFMTGKWA